MVCKNCVTNQTLVPSPTYPIMTEGDMDPNGYLPPWKNVSMALHRPSRLSHRRSQRNCDLEHFSSLQGVEYKIYFFSHRMLEWILCVSRVIYLVILVYVHRAEIRFKRALSGISVLLALPLFLQSVLSPFFPLGVTSNDVDLYHV